MGRNGTSVSTSSSTVIPRSYSKMKRKTTKMVGVVIGIRLQRKPLALVGAVTGVKLVTLLLVETTTGTRPRPQLLAGMVLVTTLLLQVVSGLQLVMLVPPRLRRPADGNDIPPRLLT